MHGSQASPAARPFVLLTVANALVSLSAFAVLINLVPMLIEQGMSRNAAALALGLGGVGQVIGRLGYARFADATSVTVRTVSVILALAVATAALALAPASAVLLIGLGMVLGLARGIYTLIQATAITDRWGPAGYGTLNGILTAPALVAAASAPFVGAALADLLGGYSAAFLVLAGSRRRRRRARRRSHPAGARPTGLTRAVHSVIIESMIIEQNLTTADRSSAGPPSMRRWPTRRGCASSTTWRSATPPRPSCRRCWRCPRTCWPTTSASSSAQGLVTRHRSEADRRRSYLRLVPDALDGLLPHRA